MQAIVSTLKREMERRGFDPNNAFELLSVACEHCCQEHSGGNGTCPPPKWEIATAE